KERALATSIFNSGTNVGAIVAPAVVPFIASAFGGRAAFIAAGIAGFVWLFLWIPFYHTPDKIKRLNPSERAPIHSHAHEKPTDAPGEKAGKSSLATVFSFAGRSPRATLWGLGLALAGLSIVVAVAVFNLFSVLGAVGIQITRAVAILWAVGATWA